jgi:hypothetical protein
MIVSTVDVLRLARDLYARAPSHIPLDQPVEPGRHCPLTAIVAAETVGGDRLAGYAAKAALRNVVGFGMSIPRWNAAHSTEEVLAAFDLAIEAEQAKAALKVEA